MVSTCVTKVLKTMYNLLHKVSHQHSTVTPIINHLEAKCNNSTVKTKGLPSLSISLSTVMLLMQHSNQQKKAILLFAWCVVQVYFLSHLFFFRLFLTNIQRETNTSTSPCLIFNFCWTDTVQERFWWQWDALEQPCVPGVIIVLAKKILRRS